MKLRGAILATMIAASSVAAAAEAPTVAVLRSSSVSQFEEASVAIIQTLERKGVRTATFDLEGRAENGPEVMKEVRKARPDLLVAVGSLATVEALEDPSPIPTVFSMVLYPQQSGFLDKGSRPVTGSSLDLPASTALRYVRRLLPGVRRVGVLYHPEETGFLVEEARRAAEELGLTLVAEEVDSPATAVSALNRILEQVDVVWSLADRHVFTPQTTPALILASVRRRIPFVGLSPAHVRAGAVMALSCDYADVGRQAAEIALRALGGADLSHIPVSSPRSVAVALNRRTAQHIGLEIPPDLESEAVEVVR